MSYAPEVIGNATRFAIASEAEAYVKDLMGRWMSVRETRVVQSDDPVNYIWNSAKGAVPVK